MKQPEYNQKRSALITYLTEQDNITEAQAEEIITLANLMCKGAKTDLWNVINHNFHYAKFE